MKILDFFLFLWVIFALLDPDPDPATQINPDADADADPDPDTDPDPKPCLPVCSGFLLRVVDRVVFKRFRDIPFSWVFLPGSIPYQPTYHFVCSSVP